MDTMTDLFSIYDLKWHRQLAKEIESRGGRRDIYRHINGKDVLYLTRYYIVKDPDYEIMIHNFHMGDFGPLHDHPWDNRSYVLEFGYNELMFENGKDGKIIKRFRGPGYRGFRKAEEAHSVELIPGSEGKVWTLFSTAKRRRKWAFHTDNGLIDAIEYMKQEGVFKANSLPDMYEDGIFPTRIVK